MKNIPGILLLFGLLLLPACSSTAEPAAPATPSLPPTTTPVRIFPTSSSGGDEIVWENLQLTMMQVEITENFINEYGSTRIPSPGQKFSWVRVQLKNTGQIGMNVPPPEHFSMLYVEAEIKPIYGYRKGYAEYTDLNPAIFPGQAVEGWLRFDIPAAAEQKDLRFVFLPESSGVGVSFSSPNYPYAEDHPIFVWNCAP